MDATSGTERSSPAQLESLAEARGSNSSNRKKKRIIVVGAGAAGIGCTRWLLDYFDSICSCIDPSCADRGNNLNFVESCSCDANVPEVLLLEARDRVGGRVNTVNVGGSAVDLGASWLHEHSDSNPMSIMANRLGLKLKNTNFDNGIAFDLKGVRIKDKVVDKAWYDLEAAFVDVCKDYLGIQKGDKEKEKEKGKIKGKERGSKGGGGLGLAEGIERSPRAIDDQIDLESLIKSKVGKAAWDEPAFQCWAADYDFEFGVSLSKLSPAAIDEGWISAIEDDLAEEDYNMVFTETGFKGILDGLISGEATDNEYMKEQQRQLRARVRKMPTSCSLPLGSSDATPIIDSTSASSSSYSSSIKSERRRRPMNILLNHNVVRIIDHSRLESKDPNSPSSSSSSSSCNDRISLQVKVESPASSKEQSINQPEMIELEADAVVVCLPLGVLKASHESMFTPALSAEKRAVISQTGFGNVVKIVMEFDKVFWPSSSEFLLVADKALCSPFEGKGDLSAAQPPQTRGLLTFFWNLFHVLGKKILVGYGLGDGADLIDQMSDDKLEVLLLSRLKALSSSSSGSYQPRPTRWFRTRWASDPYSLGTYSYIPRGVSSPAIFDSLAHKEGRRLFFAGEATLSDISLRSTVNGAFQSGTRAAEQVIQLLAE